MALRLRNDMSSHDLHPGSNWGQFRVSKCGSASYLEPDDYFMMVSNVLNEHLMIPSARKKGDWVDAD